MSDLKVIYKQIYKKYFRNFPALNISSDGDPGDRIGNELEEREELYTVILEDYSKITKIRNILKEIHKWAFFWIVIAAGIVITILLCNIVNRVLALENIEQFLDAIPIIITAFVSFITVIIGIPTIIANFLFSTKEDDNITHTIHHTQDHDFHEVELLKERYVSNKEPISKQQTTTIKGDLDV